MTRRTEKPVVNGLAVAALLAASLFASQRASAQDAIILEVIGAVRMAQPDEIRRMGAEPESVSAQSQGEQPHAEQDAATR